MCVITKEEEKIKITDQKVTDADSASDLYKIIGKKK